MDSLSPGEDIQPMRKARCDSGACRGHAALALAFLGSWTAEKHVLGQMEMAGTGNADKSTYQAIPRRLL